MSKLCIFFLLLQCLVVHPTIIQQVPSPDGTKIATLLNNGSVTINNLKGEKLYELSHWFYNITEIQFSPDNNYIATLSSDGSITLWNPKTGIKIICLSLKESIRSFRINEEGKIFVQTNIGLTIWDPYESPVIHIKNWGVPPRHN